MTYGFNAAEKFAVDNGETPIKEMLDSQGRKLHLNPREYRAEQNRRVAAFRDARREANKAFTDRVKAEQSEKAQQAQRERDERKRASIENRLRTAFLASGGDEAGWDASKDRLMSEEIERETLERSQRTRAGIKHELRRALF